MSRRNRSPRAKRLAFEVLETRATPSASPWGEGDLQCQPVQGGPHQLEGGGGNSSATSKPKATYSYAVTGNTADVVTNPTAGLALMGGSTDVDAAFAWMGAKANGGDFLVLQASGNNYYNGYVDKLVASLDSVATLTIPDALAANDPFVADQIRRAEAIFIAGGDQANYINFWTDSGLESALYEALVRNVPIGGTSAGLAILGEIDFSARNGSITSAEALANPYDSRITLDSELITPNDQSGTSLQWLDNVITDSHFQQRNRMGRTLTFLARMDADDLVSRTPRGIAVNEQTALLVEATGIAQVVGNPLNKKLPEYDQQRTVFFLQSSSNTTGVDPNVPLTYSAQVKRAGIGDTFDLGTWRLTGGVEYAVSARDGVLSSSNGSIYG